MAAPSSIAIDIESSGTTVEPATSPEVATGVKIGDPLDPSGETPAPDTDVEWIAVGKEGLVVGFARTTDLFANPPVGNETVAVYDATGSTVIGYIGSNGAVLFDHG